MSKVSVKYMNRQYGFLLSFLIAGLTVVFYGQNPVNAAVSGFVDGNIISDQVMRDKSTMSTSQIQSFLNAKGVYCTSGGNCLKNYKQDGKSAAQIIFEASRDYNINPQALIVLIQKETGLVTINDPASWRYRTATGYGCPDTAACDTQYYGFKNQVHWAARMFNAILSKNPNWYTPYTLGNNSILYNPSASCGRKSVNIQNLATVALYSYTPYVPNQAALNAGYGTGNSCSSYGNRNFYLYFTDWFGSTTVPVLFKTSDSRRVYLRIEQNYYYIPTNEILEAYGYSYSQVKIISSSLMRELNFKGDLSRVVRFGGDQIYLIDRGRRYQFTSPQMYTGIYGYRFGQEIQLGSEGLFVVADSGPLSEIVQYSSGNEVYLIESTKRRHISSGEVYTSQGSPVYSSRIRVFLSRDYIQSHSESSPILKNNIVVSTADKKPHFWNGSRLTKITDSAINNYNLPIEYVGSSAAIGSLPKNDQQLGRFVQAGGSKYIIDGRSKLLVSNEVLNSLGAQDIVFLTIEAGLSNKLSTKTFPTLFRLNNSSAVYIAKGGKILKIHSAADLTNLGYSWNSIGNISNDVSEFTKNDGGVILGKNRLIRINNSSSVYITDNDLKYYLIPSRYVFNQYNYSMNSVSNLSSSQASSYTLAGKLGSFAQTTDGNYWLISKTKRLKIPPELHSTFSVTTYRDYNPDDTTINSYSTGEDASVFLKSESTLKIYKVINGKKHWVVNRDSLKRNGGESARIVLIDQNTLDSLHSGGNLR